MGSCSSPFPLHQSPRLLGPLIRILGTKRFVDWSFDHYLNIAPPEFADERPASAEPKVPTPA